MKFLRFVDKNLEKYICVFLLVVMTVATSLQVVFRMMGKPLPWSEELARYVFVWIIYISCSYAVKEDKHVKIDAVMLLFKERGRFVLRVISNVLFFLFAVIISYEGVLLVDKIVNVQGQTSPAMGWSMGIPYSSFVVGCMLMALRLVQSTVLLFKNRGKQPEGGTR